MIRNSYALSLSITTVILIILSFVLRTDQDLNLYIKATGITALISVLITVTHQKKKQPLIARFIDLIIFIINLFQLIALIYISPLIYAFGAQSEIKYYILVIVGSLVNMTLCIASQKDHK